MSDLDENLTSILSSLIDTDENIETPNSADLQDNGSFNDSRLDFESLASCITGNDASLHQSSDENVTSLLESHLNDLARTENSSIIETSTENLDDVTSFDLDKPIESLLDSESTEFIPQDCPHSQIAEHPKDASVPAKSVLSAIDLSEHENIVAFSNESPITDKNAICMDQFEVEPSSLQNQSIQNADLFETPSNRQIVESETNDAVSKEQENTILNAECNNEISESGQEDRVEPEDGLYDEELGETIVSDKIIDEVVKESNMKHQSKKRRRIMVYDDENSDDRELEEEREKLLQSKSPTSSHHSSEPNDDGENQSDGLSNDEYVYQSENERVENFEDDDDYIRDPNEKPGPKSSKTHLYNALKAKALLESAIVIPARKKKKRILDSDDENIDFLLNQPTTSVDDIGLIPDDDNVTPFNVSIETEQDGSIVSIKNEFAIEANPIHVRRAGNKESVVVNSEKDYAKPSFIKVEPLRRITTTVKMERHHTNNKRRSNKKKETKDIFGMPLNAPYVDSSSDEDYFLPNDTTSRRNHGASQRTNNGNRLHSSGSNQRKKKGPIPDDIYFNAKVPLHILYSYDASSSDDERKKPTSSHATSHKSTLFQPTNRTLNKMPPVHRIIPRISHGKAATTHKVIPKNSKNPVKKVKNIQPTPKSTVFEQLDKLKRFLRVSGIKSNVNELLKGSKTFQERCERIRDILHRNGIEGEPTLAKCKKLKKKLKLKEEIAGLDPSVIIEAKEEEGRPKRRATRRNYVFDDADDAKKQQTEGTSQLLQKMKQIVDSDSEYELDEVNQNGSSKSNGNSTELINTSNFDSENMVATIIGSNEPNSKTEIQETPANIGQMSVPISDPVTIQSNTNELPAIAQCTTTDLDQL